MFRFNRVFFIVSNFIIAFFSFVLIFLIRYKFFNFSGVEKRSLDLGTIILFLFYSFVIVILNMSFKIYEVNKIAKIKDALLANLIISVASIGVIGGFFYFTQTNFARYVFFLGFLIIPVIMSIYNKILYFIIIKSKKPIRMLYFGNYSNFSLFERLMSEYKKWFPMEIYKVLIDEKDINILEERLKLCDLVVVDSEERYLKEQFIVLNNFEVSGGRIYSLIDIFNYFDQSIPAEIVSYQHFDLFSAYKLDSIYNNLIKRIGDIIISLSLLILTSPIMIISGILIKLSSKGNIFYIQKRVGLKGKEFDMLKFRSMVFNAEKGKALLTKENDARVTLIGKIMRPFRIDELPQLINILKGDMSFIGPRPERKELIDQIVKDVPLFKKRLLVKPGLTGWAQVKFSYVNRIDQMNKKLSYDLFYINNLNFLLDFKILLYTIETIIFRRGAI
ncbi:MAG: hypothetical protein A2086_13500 [Spirochaetes bacterium GWD1_27_9]|nr:MAG: hypothetical protein A2Z98_02800 [Spirochaetes bacterium GWB1_27_13]OHD23110.1 MAG: hypothetical protein A2Y34_16985 [Spirochaetes bacterium GWC1_27_15]OHD39922.1 MAG: hypothetical protein A2086_13500 [Spirochaetes bacterium GWD1_27_9]